MESPRPSLIVLARAPDALCALFGVSLVERLLRTVQRIGFREATIVTNSNQVVDQLAKPSWARSEVTLRLVEKNPEEFRVSDIHGERGGALVISANYYYDPRLLRALSEQTTPTMLVDSGPPLDCARLWSGSGPGVARPFETGGSAVLLDRDWLKQNRDGALLERLAVDAAGGRMKTLDAARQPAYVMDLRKDVRPVFFPAPSHDLVPVAEEFLCHAAQNGVLDFPGFFHSPIEDRIVRVLCRTAITPNQVTFVTMLIGLTVTVLFASGHLWWGVALAFAVGVLDGVDGKLARTKIETTTVGAFEHTIDYCIELSWWMALAFHFYTTSLPSAFWLAFLLVGTEVIGCRSKKAVKKRLGRTLEDVSNFDRFVRCIGGRRNINIWILIAALVLGDPVNGFVLFCWWGAATAAVHFVRALQILTRRDIAVRC